ncbi:uncharacterized protein F5147DRAFT_276430 [Suillus discolor]|uniref:Uncharacterized protein n=1 Tax=Suillus discolor TaxID=1912936 RepID=A0A9P7JSC3_9AGAM|nr:uncharacterized protein F5147DRAFT_276430 [Suillus discolor]KAG2103786.1 hypothetical protein F5147DRAFT_276430 [Suillus discolor]
MKTSEHSSGSDASSTICGFMACLSRFFLCFTLARDSAIRYKYACENIVVGAFLILFQVGLMPSDLKLSSLCHAHSFVTDAYTDPISAFFKFSCSILLNHACTVLPSTLDLRFCTTSLLSRWMKWGHVSGRLRLYL